MITRSPAAKTWRTGLAIVLLFLVSSLCFAQATDLPPGDRLPLTVIDMVKEAGTSCDHDDADWIIVKDFSMNRVKQSGVTEIWTHQVYKVLTEAGCKTKSVLDWGFDPLSQYIEVREVNIIRGDEKIAVDVKKVKELPAPQRAIYWSDKVQVLQLPRLKVGDGIEVRTYRKGFTYALLANVTGKSAATPSDDKFIPPMPEEYFAIIEFEEEVPIIEKKFVLALPKGKKLHSRVYNGTLFSETTYTVDDNPSDSLETDSTYYSWWIKDIPARIHEPRQPDNSDFVRKVVMATVESWEKKSRWFDDANKDQFYDNKEIKAKVDEIFAEHKFNAKTPEKVKAKALLHWVAQNIRYSGQTMGKGEGFTLHPGDMIFRERSGVCKDIAGMLITMMRTAGMKAYPAMTMAGSRIEDLPADQFNHCVVALHTEDGDFEMYDPTWVPWYNEIWSKLETEQHYVMGLPEGVDPPEGKYLRQIPYSPPEESPLKINHTATLLEDGTLEGTFKLEGAGALDSRLRRIFTRNRMREVKWYIEELMSNISDRVELIDYSHLNEVDFDNNMWWQFKYRIPEYAMKVGDSFEFKSPMMQLTKSHGYLFRAGTTNWAKERKTDVFMYYTQLIDGNETIKLPKKFEVVNAKASDEIDETFAYFKAEPKMGKKAFELKNHFELRRRQIPPSGYAGFRKAVNGYKDFADIVYRAEKGGKK